MGYSLRDRRHWKEAIAAMQDVLARIPEGTAGSIGLRDNLAIALMDKGDTEEAVKLFHENIRIWPNAAGVRLNLGAALIELGRFPEALEALRRGQQLANETGSRFRAPAERLVREAERLVELDRRLETGKPDPAHAAEALELAEVCYCKQRYADAVGIYRRAFDQEPTAAADVDARYRYKAACAAALAAAGRGETTESLDTSRRAELRQQALTWLRADLDAWRQRAQDPKARPTVEAELRLWQRHPNLASLRDPAAVAQMPAGEQQTWQQFWADVYALLGQVQAAPG
jgi:tetratricopeptide (TPR) repeat protein